MPHPFYLRAIASIFALLAIVSWDMAEAAVAAEEPAASLSLHPDTMSPTVFQRVEFQVADVPSAANPFDPDSLAIDLTVTDPSGGQTNIPAFFYRSFERSLDRRREKLAPQDEGQWRIRWLPPAAGHYKLAVTATVKGQTVADGRLEMDVAPSQAHGVARVEPTGQRYFQLDDGTPLFLNGLCACWHGRRGTYDYDDWLPAYQQAGINYIRIWMWPQAFGIEWDRDDKLAYRLDNAWRLDHVLAEAQKCGVYVMLCLDYHGIFEVKPDYWGGNNFWVRHPYNAANGGPCQTQNDFFTDDAAKELYRKRLRYLVARWSAFPNLLAWEFFNEIDNEYSYLKHDDVIAWHRDMGSYLREIDPAKHLISSSFTGGSKRSGLYSLPQMDFAQYHSYNEEHPAQMTAKITSMFFEKYHKPFFVSEYGTDWRGWKPDKDPHFRALHQAIWSGVFTGAAGTDMTWWWEHIHSKNLYRHWSALTTYLQGTGMGRADLRPAQFRGEARKEGPVLEFGVVAHDEAFVWLLDRACNWPQGAMNEHPAPITDAHVTLTGVDNGTWTIEWFDTLQGRCVATQQRAAQDRTLQLNAPPFAVDIAARLKKQ